MSGGYKSWRILEAPSCPSFYNSISVWFAFCVVSGHELSHTYVLMISSLYNYTEIIY